MEDQVYIFKVDLDRRQISRTIELKGSTSLYEFAEEIVSAFEFDLDHAFGFHDSINDVFESKTAYTLFFDEGIPTDPNERSVKYSYVHEVFRPNKKMVFHFDYGVDWMFLLECLGVAEPEPGTNYPMVTRKKGKAIKQYLDSDDEYEYDYLLEDAFSK